MARYRALWLQLAREQYDALPGFVQQQLRRRIEQLLERPELPRSSYDPGTDQWTTTYGDGAGLLLVAIKVEHRTIIVLRLVHLS
jgi:hypothetical protein